MVKHPTGIVLDVDDTIVDTSLKCAHLMWEEFPVAGVGNARQLLTTYGIPAHVPAWKTEVCMDAMAGYLNSAEFLSGLQPVHEAREGVQLIETKVPVAFYLTSRLSMFQDVTYKWLKHHGFPDAPVICREPFVTDRDWKVKYLAEHYPQTKGIIDNELYVPTELKYQGKLIELIKFKKITPHNDNQIVVNSWRQVFKHIAT